MYILHGVRDIFYFVKNIKCDVDAVSSDPTEK